MVNSSTSATTRPRRARCATPDDTSADATLARRAARQHGLLTRAQLLACGLDANAISYRVRTDVCIASITRSSAVGHAAPSPRARLLAAVLACGPGAVLSHPSAAALWGIAPQPSGPPDVTVANRCRHAGVRVHESRSLSVSDVTVRLAIPVTTAARTLLDLAEVLGDRALARAVNEAQVARLVRLPQIVAQIERARGRHGAARLRVFVDDGGAPTRSALEDAFLAFVERHGLPRPQVNQHVAGHEVDMLWPAARVIVELDGHAFHGTRVAFDRDRDRDADLLAAGYRVLRLTWRRLTLQPEREAARLRRILAAPR